MLNEIEPYNPEAPKELGECSKKVLSYLRHSEAPLHIIQEMQRITTILCRMHVAKRYCTPQSVDIPRFLQPRRFKR